MRRGIGLRRRRLSEKLSERMKPYCISTKQFRLSPDEVMAEIQALEAERDQLKEKLSQARLENAVHMEQKRIVEARLAKAQELVEKWRSDNELTEQKLGYPVFAIERCANELEKALGGDEK
jgi:hypothetical protein